jgi:hypothetical protein
VSWLTLLSSFLSQNVSPRIEPPLLVESRKNTLFMLVEAFFSSLLVVRFGFTIEIGRRAREVLSEH